jgi:preprotein translocase subunit SecA
MKQKYKNIKIAKETKLYDGFDAFSNRIIGKIKNIITNNKVLTSLKEDAQSVHRLSLTYNNLGDLELNKKISDYQKSFKLNKIDDKELLKAFAVVVEIGYRETNKRAYEVQIIGAIALVKKYIIEMSTGEGKTLTASLAAVILGWMGKPVHILTSNDYLASRDAETLDLFYKRANLKVGAIISTTEHEDRKKIYSYEIVYSTAKDILADFLKDRMQEVQQYSINNFLIKKISNKDIPTDYLLRGLDTVIVDEADSVLADDAVTPLIISTTGENRILQESVQDAHKIAVKLVKDKHYTLNEKFHDITLNDIATQIIEAHIYSFSNIWRSKDRREFLIKQALSAKELYELNKQYIIKDGKIVIIDEKTGRIMNERTWGNGLHQAIEVKEGLEITDPTTTFSKMSFQQFFRLYTHLCGMSGTLQNLQNEFWEIYSTQILKIPTHVQSKMIILQDKIYLNKKDKENNIVSYIESLNNKKIPVLVGVATIKDCEVLTKKLKKLNISYTILNALYDNEEAEIIAKAGNLSTVTIATNMAGRGTNIQITDEVNQLGGLHIITTQRDKSRRIDMQFFGRCARQGQNGTAISFLSLEDSILKNYTPIWLNNYLTKKFAKQYIQSFSKLLYCYYQNKIETDISKIRNKTLLREFSMNDSMSYTK